MFVVRLLDEKSLWNFLQFQKPCVCFCDEPDENLKPASSDLQKKVVTCKAIESVGGAKIGCRNKVTDFRLR